MTNIYNLFKYIESIRPEYKPPLKAKLLYDQDSITEDELKVKGNLNLAGLDIEKLPNNLKVEGFLSLYSTHIKQLPSGLEVGTVLHIGNTPISELPEDIKVGGSIFAQYSLLEKLPDNFKVQKDLNLSGTPLSEKYSMKELRKMYPIKGKIYV